MKSKRIKLGEITANQLNGDCLRTMGQCTLKLRANHGVTLKLSDRKALPRLRREIKKTQDKQLMELYGNLKTFLGQSLREHGIVDAS